LGAGQPADLKKNSDFLTVFCRKVACFVLKQIAFIFKP